MDSELHIDVAGSGPIILYLHGLGDTGELPPVLVAKRPDRTWIRPTHPGFPKSSAANADSIKEVGTIYMRLLKQLLAERGEQRCTILAASLGGGLLLSY